MSPHSFSLVLNTACLRRLFRVSQLSLRKTPPFSGREITLLDNPEGQKSEVFMVWMFPDRSDSNLIFFDREQDF